MRVELNITLKCNQACLNCNRFCDRIKQEEHLPVEDVVKFLDQTRHRKIKRVKVVGGEPLLHPNFMEIFMLLKKAVKRGQIEKVKVDTNQTVPYPKGLWEERTPNIKIGGLYVKRKRHYPMWHPLDIGYVTGASPNCAMIRRCGFSLDKKGWLPCSSAIMIARLFNLEHLYKEDFPTKVWGLNELCQHCIFAMPETWLKEHAFPIVNTPKEWQKPSNIYREVIKKYVQTNQEPQKK